MSEIMKQGGGLLSRRRALFLLGTAVVASPFAIGAFRSEGSGILIPGTEPDIDPEPGNGGIGGGTGVIPPEEYSRRFSEALGALDQHPELRESISSALGSAVLLDAAHHIQTPAGSLFVSEGKTRKIITSLSAIVPAKTGDSATIRTEPFTRFGFPPRTDPRIPATEVYYGDKEPVAGALLAIDRRLGFVLDVVLTTANPANPYRSGDLSPVPNGFNLAAGVAQNVYQTIS